MFAPASRDCLARAWMSRLASLLHHRHIAPAKTELFAEQALDDALRQHFRRIAFGVQLEFR